MYLQYSCPSLYLSSFATISMSIFADVPPSCIVPGPSQWFFHFDKEIVISWTHIKWIHWMFHYQRRKRSVRAAAMWLLALSWRMMRFCTTKWRRFLLSPWDYDLFTKVKELLRGTLNNTRDELIRAVGQLIRNINKDGCTDGVRCLPNIWQKVTNRGATILNVHKCCIPVNKGMSEILNCCHYFSSNPCIFRKNY